MPTCHVKFQRTVLLPLPKAYSGCKSTPASVKFFNRRKVAVAYQKIFDINYFYFLLHSYPILHNMSEVETKKKQVPADDFEDDFQEDDAVFSDNEPAIEDEEAPVVKRKAPESEEPPKKKKKQQKKKKVSNNPFDTINIWDETPEIQAAYLQDRQKIALPKLSAVELEEQYLPESGLVNNENFKQEHVLDALPNFVKFGVAGHKKLAKKPTVLASPVTLIVTHSAVRAVDLGR